MTEAKTQMQFTTKELSRLKELYPKAKHFIYIALPKDKEASFTINKGASLKKGMADQIGNLKKEFNYTDEDLKIESYDLRDVE